MSKNITLEIPWDYELSLIIMGVYWFGFLQSQTPVEQSGCESLTGRGSQEALVESAGKANEEC